MSILAAILSIAGLIVGLVVGGLTTFAIVSSRITALERDYNYLNKEFERFLTSFDSRMAELVGAINTHGTPVRAWRTADDRPAR